MNHDLPSHSTLILADREEVETFFEEVLSRVEKLEMQARRPVWERLGWMRDMDFLEDAGHPMKLETLRRYIRDGKLPGRKFSDGCYFVDVAGLNRMWRRMLYGEEDDPGATADDPFERHRSPLTVMSPEALNLH